MITGARGGRLSRRILCAERWPGLVGHVAGPLSRSLHTIQAPGDNVGSVTQARDAFSNGNFKSANH